MKIIDCTIRDGGHLNNWEFNPSCVRSSYYASLNSGIDYFEVGYRMPKTKKDLGEFGYCSDDNLKNILKYSEKCKVAIMVNANSYQDCSFSKCDANLTVVKMIRIACYPYEIKDALIYLEELKSKGYEVCLNLMAFSELTETDFNILQKWPNKDVLSAIYFADSFGSFTPDDISSCMNKLKKVGFKQIGFHSHNNLQMAFANTLRAIEEGVSFVDASIYGMGRGAGNLPIEILVSYLEKTGQTKYNPVPYLDVIERHYLGLAKDIKWGYSLNTLMGGIKNIHPYYVDNLAKEKLYTVSDIWNLLDVVKRKCPISFCNDDLNKAMQDRLLKPLSEENARLFSSKIEEEIKIIPEPDSFIASDFVLKDAFSKKKFLIIANGPSIVEYKDKISALINSRDYITIGVNNLPEYYQPDFWVFTSKKRFLDNCHKIDKGSKLIVPSFFGKRLVSENYSGKCYYFNISPTDKKNSVKVPVEDINQNIVYNNVTISASLLAFVMGAKEINVLGMDGYGSKGEKEIKYFYNENLELEEQEKSTIRYQRLCFELERISTFLANNGVAFSIITPTSHKEYYRSEAL